jgi:hypothetical protein
MHCPGPDFGQEQSAGLCLDLPVPVAWELRMCRSWTPSIVPNGSDQTVYIVLEDFGRLARAYRETSIECADLEAIISDLMIGGQYSDPFASSPSTPSTGAVDVSKDNAREILRRVARCRARHRARLPLATSKRHLPEIHRKWCGVVCLSSATGARPLQHPKHCVAGGHGVREGVER